MNRTALTTAVTAGALAACLAGAGAAGAAPAAPAKQLDKQDAMYLTENYQTDLAEITLGHYIQKTLPKGSLAHDLANRTVTDHTKIAAIVRELAKKYDVTLPSAPNSIQLAAAKNVKTAHHTSYRYFLAEIAGHKTSIAEATNEIRKGQSKYVVDFTKFYKPIAQGHLHMAQRDLPYAVH